MKPNRSIRILFVVAILAALVLAACGPGNQPEGGAGQGSAATKPVAPNTGGNGNGGGQSQPSANQNAISKDLLLDPALANDADSLMVISYLYEGLVRLDNSEIAPALATSWTVSDDGLDYILTLRPNVNFHDGSPFNADAVIANFNRWFDPNDPAHGAGDYATWVSIFGGFKGEKDDKGQPKSNFDGVEKVDQYTVLIHLNKPDDKFLAKLVNPAFSMVSPAALGADYFGSALGKDGGSGAYQIASWSDTGLSLQPFSGYWGTAATGNLEFPFK